MNKSIIIGLIACIIVSLLIFYAPPIIDIVVNSELAATVVKTFENLKQPEPTVLVEDIALVFDNKILINTPTSVKKSFTVDTNEIWIHVDISKQTLYVSQGNRRIKEFDISSGLSLTPTLLGSYKIYAMYPDYTMLGQDGPIPHVKWNMFYHAEYAIHGAYWHDNFGKKMSRGCINMRTENAKWLYSRVEKGTHVYIYE